MIDFLKLKATLHSWDKTELVMMHYVFYLLLQWLQFLKRDIAYMFMKDTGLLFVCFFLMELSDFIITCFGK